jgi:3',5'-cyclic AMP phosphodiesterase CpdA
MIRPQQRLPNRRLAWSVALAAVLLLIAGCASGQNPSATDVSFVVFGDNRGGQDGRQPAVFAALVQKMAALNPDFVVGTGDYIYGAGSQRALSDQWNDFFRAMAPLQAHRRTYFAPATGNHEISGGVGRKLFRQYFERFYFSFDWGGSHFIILDTEVPGQESRIAGEQLDWLKRALPASQRAAHTFVALHRPLFPVGPHKGDSLDKYPQERDGLHALFVRHNVTCVFEGHEHLYRRQTRDGVEYIITGGGGAPLYASPDKGGFHHFLYVTADQRRYKIDIVKTD